MSILSTWTDERLSWNSSDYGGITEVLYYQGEVWKPPLILSTPIEFVTIWNDDMHVKVSSDGIVTMENGQVLESACTFNMENWPFDKQVCDVGFVPIDYRPSQVLLNIREPGVVVMSTFSSSEWTLERQTFITDSIGYYSEARFRFYIKRQSSFYVLSILLPMIGLNVISTLVFLLPNDSGERVGYSITIMLSLSVFLTIVTDDLPKTSNPVSLLCIFLNMSMSLSLLIMLITILNMRIYFKQSDERPGKFYRVLVKIAKFDFFKNNKVMNGKFVQPKEHRTNGGAGQSKDGQSVEDGESYKHTIDECDGIESTTWQEVSHAIDVICFVFFTVLTSLGSLIFTACMASGSKYKEP
ncbi:neuronal acetylcholine receptor subunit alpha-5-like [Mya arenaria]|uniref:neuronal acetylcholine receptor subunit alpha-5-like n=1 Tax=Mya arenaria TaxID=6604 RepID=UPI0022E3542B|nr:neuronal acetylcholine receptor subunit alpha-5-like [Mya arenaria]